MIDIQELAAQSLASRTISRFEHQMMSVLVDRDDLDEQERVLVARLSYGIRHGLLEIID